jgi:hypothetical protein
MCPKCVILLCCELVRYTEQWWNDTRRGKLKYWEKSLSKLHIVNYRFHIA